MLTGKRKESNVIALNNSIIKIISHQLSKYNTLVYEIMTLIYKQKLMYIVLNTLWKQNRSIQITELNSSYLLILSLDHLGTFPLLLNNINYMY